MGFDILDVVRAQASGVEGLTNHVFLSGTVGHGQSAAGAVLVHGRPADHRQHPVAVRQGVPEAFQHDHGAALAADHAVGACGEGFASAVRSQYAAPGQCDRGDRGQQQIDAPRQRPIALSIQQAATSLMNGDQRRRAGRIDRHAGAMEAERVGQPARGRVQRVPRDQVGVDFLEMLGGGQQLRVIVGRNPNKHPGPAAGQSPLDLSRILQGFPAHLQQQAMLRIQADRFPRRDAEELGIELIDRLAEKPSEKSARIARRSAEFTQCPRVPPARGDLGNGVRATQKQLPEGFRMVGPARKPARHADDRNRLGLGSLQRVDPVLHRLQGQIGLLEWRQWFFL